MHDGRPALQVAYNGGSLRAGVKTQAARRDRLAPDSVLGWSSGFPDYRRGAAVRVPRCPSCSTVSATAIEDVHPQCGRELCALARVNMSSTREPRRSSDDDLPASRGRQPAHRRLRVRVTACRGPPVSIPGDPQAGSAFEASGPLLGMFFALSRDCACCRGYRARHFRGEVFGSTRPAPDGRSPYRPAEAATCPPPRRRRLGARPNRP
jgi:hypothetical protein